MYFCGDTIQQRIDKFKATTGFDYMRLGLALCVLVIHSVAISYGRQVEANEIWSSWLGGPARLVLPVFFALSGFLVSGSIFRVGSITGFVLLRVMRILPALTVEVCLSAIVLGAIFTTLPLSEYFTNPVFFDYFKNIYGEIHFPLPGVFLDNPISFAINISLWTIPAEFECYAALILLMAFGIIRHRVLVFSLVIFASFVTFYKHVILQSVSDENIGAVEPRMLALSFLGGVVVYLYRDRIRLNSYAFFFTILLSTALCYHKQFAYLAVFPVAYATVYLGMLMPKKLPFIFDGDYSYGMYLYAFPIQQTICHLLPDYRFWWLNVIISIPITFMFSYFSWHMIEKHFLKYKMFAKPDSVIPSIELRAIKMTKNVLNRLTFRR
jgi:peptidoglycan/LPS O-acetylase OafA/YrhL